MKRKLLVLALSGFVLSSAAFAATTISSNAINVKATVVPVCAFMVGTTPGNFDTAAPLDTPFGPDLSFGSLTPDPGAGTVMSTAATAIIRCSLTTPFTAATSSTAPTPFTMSSGLSTIPYTTSVTPAAGVGLGMGSLVGSTGNITITVKGQITGPAYNVAPGNYTDPTLKLNITF